MSTYKSLIVESLTIQDPRSKKNITLSGDRIYFSDERGITRIRLELYSEWDNEPRITFFDHNGKERFSVALQGNGNPYLGLADGNGNDRIGMHITDGNTPQLFLNDANCMARLEVEVDEDNEPEIRFSDRTGERRLVLDVDEYGKISPLRLYDADGNEMYRLPVPFVTTEGN